MGDLVKPIRIAMLMVGGLVCLGVSVIVISLALPVQVWRTGELEAAPLASEPATAFSPSPVRVWIDTDAACGHGPRTDPDDCLAILLLAQDQRIEVVGVSTVFGNAPLGETDRTTRALMVELAAGDWRSPPVYRGSSERLPPRESPATTPSNEAHEMLRRALAQEPLTILALGPLTNIAIALRDRPDLQANVTRLVAVMGRRKGHVFHPIEGATARSFLGHGPVFRDFNFTADENATVHVTAMRLPMTLIPYEAARAITLEPTVLDRMEAGGGAAAWVARRARQWMNYWREDIGLVGFYPFDLVAGAYVVQPSFLRCANVPVAVEQDTWLFGWLGYRGLFINLEQSANVPSSTGASALYCPRVSESLGPWLTARLANEPSDHAVYVTSFGSP